MLCSDLITHISGYDETNNLKYISKIIYDHICTYDKCFEWNNRYNNYFIVNQIKMPPLADNYIWKKEYMRIVKFEYWKYWCKYDFNTKSVHTKNEMYCCKKIPKEIKNLSNCLKINLFSNRITKIPKQLYDLSNLQYLHISFNNITKLPKEIGKLRNLKSLDIRFNKIKKLPKQITLLEKLEYLYINGNEITELSTKFNKLENLLILYVDKKVKIPDFKKCKNLTIKE